MKKFITGAALSALALPMIAMAQTTLFSILAVIRNVMDILIPLLITGALIFFIYGVIQYITAKDGDAKEKGRKVLVQGVLGLFIIVSVWGLIGIIQSTFGVGAGGVLTQEQLPGVGY